MHALQCCCFWFDVVCDWVGFTIGSGLTLQRGLEFCVLDGCWPKLYDWKDEGNEDQQLRISGGMVEAPVAFATSHTEGAQDVAVRMVSQTLREVIIDCRDLPLEEVKKHSLDGLRLACGTIVLETIWVRGTLPIQAWMELSTAQWPSLLEVDLTGCFQDCSLHESPISFVLRSRTHAFSKNSTNAMHGVDTPTTRRRNRQTVKQKCKQQRKFIWGDYIVGTHFGLLRSDSHQRAVPLFRLGREIYAQRRLLKAVF
mmetsp:Transcript_77416/g.250538  ORF Transcript_77416/g.250538 Transcript_77416/m.250538 type:complete len:255 (+) Transcript_77416:50-814(+)